MKTASSASEEVKLFFVCDLFYLKSSISETATLMTVQTKIRAAHSKTNEQHCFSPTPACSVNDEHVLEEDTNSAAVYTVRRHASPKSSLMD